MSEKPNKTTLVLGLMSGTSLDGLDMALCSFEEAGNAFRYRILRAETINYDNHWKQQLSAVKDVSAEQYFKTDALYADFVADQINQFLKGETAKPNYIASHGHTVFHQPAHGFSTQMGSGAILAAKTGITTVCDFRSLDVANAGQGAPLVPIGDRYLFSDYAACLNIGGIANISFEQDGQRMAYDLCEANLIFNFLAEKKGHAFDKGGLIAKSGKPNSELISQLAKLPYYSQKGAKSLGREWLEKNILPLFQTSDLSIEDLMATAVAHVAQVIANDLNEHQFENLLVTGGGAFNEFLIQQIQNNTKTKLVIPDPQIINFKEALIFAFLGYLRINHRVNTLASVTGAKSDSVGGAVYLAS